MNAVGVVARENGGSPGSKGVGRSQDERRARASSIRARSLPTTHRLLSGYSLRKRLQHDVILKHQTACCCASAAGVCNMCMGRNPRLGSCGVASARAGQQYSYEASTGQALYCCCRVTPPRHTNCCTAILREHVRAMLTSRPRLCARS